MGRIRLASAADSGQILDIYAPYIETTAITFEIEVPSLEEFASRVERISEKFPYLVYERDGVVAAYAYASLHRERAAYLYDADVSVYLADDCKGSGVAAKLYACLFELLTAMGCRNVYAGCTQENTRSLRFHEKLGFTVVGTYHKTGYKLGRWHDVTWLERTIAPYDDNPQPPKSVRELPESLVRDILERHNAG